MWRSSLGDVRHAERGSEDGRAILEVALEGRRDVLGDRQAREDSRASWNDRPRPSLPRLVGAARGDVVCRMNHTVP